MFHREMILKFNTFPINFMLPISLLLFDFDIKYMYIDLWKYYARVL